jgi:predicted SnoaL-like aldol condensation-catalyzing enzyme
MTRYLVLGCWFFFLLASCQGNKNTGTKNTAMINIDEVNAEKAIARRWFDEVINQRDPDAITDIYAVDYIHHGPEGVDMSDLEVIKTFAAKILAASDDRHAVVNQQVAEGNLVVTRFTSTGHQTGSFNGVEATGNIWTTEGIVISRIENGKIAEDWEIIHNSGM